MTIRRSLPWLVILVAAGLLLWFLLPKSDSGAEIRDTTRRSAIVAQPPPPVLRGPQRQSEQADSAPGVTTTQADALVGEHRGPPPKGVPPPTSPKRPDKLGEASRDRETADLLVRIDDGSGHPRDGVHFVLTTMDGGKVKTLGKGDIGSDGEAELNGLPAGRHVLSVQVGDLRRFFGADFEAGRVTEVDLSIPPGATLEGVVRHIETGPVAGAKVQLGANVMRSSDLWSDRLLTTTDAEGRYRLEEVPEGRWPVSLTGKVIGYHPRARAYVSILGPGTHTQDFLLGQVTLQGTIRDSQTKALLSGTSVTIQDPLYMSGGTNADGAFAFRDVPPGRYTFSISKDGYGHRFFKNVEVPEVGAGHVDFELDPASSVLLHLVDSDEAPIPGPFIISIDPVGEGEGFTNLSTNLMADEKGRADYPKIVPGNYDLGVRVDGFMPSTVRTEVGQGCAEVRFLLERKPDEVGDVSLKGRVLEASTRRPIPGVSLSFQSAGYKSAVTDEDGVFRVSKLGPGTYGCWVTKDGYGIRYVRDLFVPQSAEKPLEILLDPAATVHFDLMDSRGGSVSGRLTLAVHPQDGTTGTRVSTGIEADPSGHAVYRRIVPGRYTLKLIQEGAGSAEFDADIRLGDNRFTARLQLDQGPGR